MKIALVSLLSIVWIALMVWGFKSILDYDLKASAEGSYLSKWPAAGKIDRTAGRWTLVMAVHRQCPCTRASINELEKIMTKCNDNLETDLLLYRPAGNPEWTNATMAAVFAKSAEVHRIDDPDGSKSDLFKATTSGECFLYDPSGQLRFHGGITGARGHEGDNDGEDAVVALVDGKTTGFQKSAYFGCSIH